MAQSSTQFVLLAKSQMNLDSQLETPVQRLSPLPARPFYSIPELAERWRCSRASVYNRIRGEKVIDFAVNGRKGHKLVPLEVVLKIERAHLRVLR